MLNVWNQTDVIIVGEYTLYAALSLWSVTVSMISLGTLYTVYCHSTDS